MLSDVLVARPFAIDGPDTLEHRTTDTAELLGVAERLGDPVTAYRARWTRYRVAVKVDDPAEAERCLRRAGQLYRLLAPYPDQVTVWAVGLSTGSVSHHLGQLARPRRQHALVLDERDGSGDREEAARLRERSRTGDEALGVP